jgi:hypothetical protein
MRVYHFVSKKYGLDDLYNRRLKVATLDELNDPFEFFGIDLSNEDLRGAFRRTKEQLSVNRGLLCFSRNRRNPVMWSHYADKHRGFCFGFDVPDHKLQEIKYTRRRLVIEAERLLAGQKLDEEIVSRFLFTKYSHWRYEAEERSFVSLERCHFENNLYFTKFSDELQLVEVFVGAESSSSRADVRESLGDLASEVNVMKTRLAFKTFRVVQQRNKALW